MIHSVTQPCTTSALDGRFLYRWTLSWFSCPVFSVVRSSASLGCVFAFPCDTQRTYERTLASVERVVVRTEDD